MLVHTSSGLLVVQCKYWKRDSVIHEKHILHLHGTVSVYQAEYPDATVEGILITTASCSDEAKHDAETLDLMTQEDYPIKPYPLVKCINSDGKKHYFLPYEKEYDTQLFSLANGDTYVQTISEAEQLGYHHP